MIRDLRDTALYEEAKMLYEVLRQPGTGQISDAAEADASPDGTHAVFAGALTDNLIGVPPTRICVIELASGALRIMTSGPNTDRMPKYSPDGRHIAFLSDRHKPGSFQLYLLDAINGVARATPFVDGWVEYLHWSPDGKQILLGVAGHGADISGGQGAVTSTRDAESLPSWIPEVEKGDESYRWRRVWIYGLADNQVRQVGSKHGNIWEAVWCSNEALAAVVSDGPTEGAWYSACLCAIQIRTGELNELFRPDDQLAWPAASRTGEYLAVVEATCSDRGIVAGDLRVIRVHTGDLRRIDTRGVDVSYTEWRSDRRLLLAGHRGLETVIGVYDTVTETFCETWSSRGISTGGYHVSVSGIEDTGDCVLVGESFLTAPEIALIRGGKYQRVKSFDLGYGVEASVIKSVEDVSWPAPDGLEIQGWLLRPQGHGPHPLIMHIHGGPVWHCHPLWLGRRLAAVLMLVKRGFAVFFPNPRGSSGRGQAFARQVLGDMGGADTYDCLSGLDYLVARGIADPARLGVTGTSYGGFMTSWLVTQDSRFAAAVSVAPVTNQVSEHLIGNIPHFVKLFLADEYTNFGGKYFNRSPVMYAHQARTPVLNICGALDRCTPPEEAVQFHNALRENGVESVLITYPEEGHGVRNFPAAIDYAARVVTWFQEHMGVAPYDQSRVDTRVST